MNDKHLSAFGIISFSALIALFCAVFPQVAETPHGSDTIAGVIDGLPASAAGVNAYDSGVQADAYMGGAAVSGRVNELYVKLAENLFIAVNQAPKHLLKTPDRWVEVEFPELLANGTHSARAMITSVEAGIQVGDVVEIKFAHKDNLRFFPVKEVTRVTSLVARRDEMLAKDFERRIIARNNPVSPEEDLLTRVLGVTRKISTTQVSTVAGAGR